MMSRLTSFLLASSQNKEPPLSLKMSCTSMTVEVNSPSPPWAILDYHRGYKDSQY